jgi:glycosyltransferase involved in cell wall biosynthesis
VRVLHLIHSVDPAGGGPAEGLRQLVSAGRALGDVHEVLTLDAPDAACLRGFPEPLHALGPSYGRYAYTPRLVPWLADRVARFDALVVHGLWQYHGIATRTAARRARVPYFVFCHGMLDPWFKRSHPLKHAKKRLYWEALERTVLREADAVLFTTEEEARLAPLSFGPLGARATVVGFGLELEAARSNETPDAFFARHPETRGRRIVLFLGRLHRKKGCDLLVDAFADVAASDPALHLVMAGPDQTGWQRDLEAQARRRGIASRVTWCGMLEGASKWSALRAADVFALPSHQENFGIAVAEALAVGLPVLISDKVNIWREVVGDGAGHAGPDTAEDTTALLRHWLALDDDERRAMRAHASACFERRFRMSAAARRLREAMSGKRAPRPARDLHGSETKAL